MSKKCAVTLLLVLVFLTAKPQYFSTGEDPASLKWRQIVTPNFQLIYPEDFEEKAAVMAAWLEKVYEVGSSTLHHKPRKISVILHTRTVRSNGLVGWAPRRMELFTPPHQDIYAQEWLQQLVLHEFRHVVQVDKIRSQIPALIRALLGEQGEALITGLYLPFWFIEGDAVISETALSNSGRGRYPPFLMEHKAQVVEKGVFSFDKAFNGSYKDFVPDHYKLGYHLVGETRAIYGSDLWSHTIDQLASRPLSVTPVNKMLKLLTGKNQEQLYRMVFDSLHQEWEKEDRDFHATPSVVLTKPSGVYENYRHNHVLPDGKVVSLKTSYDHIPRFVTIDESGNEETLVIPGQIFEESVGYRNQSVIWSEYVPDERWSHSGRSFIRIFQIENSTIKTLIPEYKCFAPAISPDEHNVSVVETDFGNQYYLSVYDASTGDLKARYQTPENNYFFNPVWKDDQELFVVVLTEKGKQLARVNPFEGKLSWLSGVEPGELKHLTPWGDKLFFISGHTGKSELWSLNLRSDEVLRELPARFGLESPAFSPDGKSLVLSDYTAGGFRLIKVRTDDCQPVTVRSIPKGQYPLAARLAVQEPGIVDFTNVDTTGYISKPYTKGLHLFNIHSWAPASFDLDSYTLDPGVSVVSQNKLGTAETSVGYKWHSVDRVGQTYLNFEYRGWYPMISLEGYTGKKASSYGLITEYKDGSGNIVSRDTVMKRFTWNETGIDLDVRIPFNFTRGAFHRLLQPEVRFSYLTYGHRESTPGNFISGDVRSMVWRLYYHQMQRQAIRDVQPDWGLVLDGAYRHTPFGDNDMGSMLSYQASIYLPGLLKNHGLNTYLAFQKRNPGKYSYSDAIKVPRGWHSFNSNHLISSSVKYSLPLLYPDLNLGKFIYLRRIRAELFYDRAWIKGNSVHGDNSGGIFRRTISSVGADLTTDCNFLRFYAPANMGFRTIYLPVEKKTQVEFLLSVDFNSF